jgi:hypothetical protein
MSPAPRRRWIAALLLAAGFTLRLGYMVHIHRGEPPHRVTDPESYDLMAHNILEHGQLTTELGVAKTDREPLYPLVLALSHLLFGPSDRAGLAFNLFFAMGACWAVYLLAEAMFQSELCSLLALAAACFYPEWIYYTAFLLRETLLSLLLAVWALVWTRRERLGLTRAHLLMGALCGVIGLIRSPMLPLAPVFALLSARVTPPRAWVRTIGAFLVCAGLIQVPWIARNYLVTGRFVAGASMGGKVMYESFFVDYDRPEIPLEVALNPADPVAVAAAPLDAVAADHYFYRACRDVLLHRPGLFWYTFLRKAAKLWRPYPHEGWDYGHSLLWLKIVGLISNGGLLAFGLAGAWRARRKPGTDFLIMVPAVMTLIYGLFWAVTRYHAPLMFAFMPPAALTAASLVQNQDL